MANEKQVVAHLEFKERLNKGYRAVNPKPEKNQQNVMQEPIKRSTDVLLFLRANHENALKDAELQDSPFLWARLESACGRESGTSGRTRSRDPVRQGGRDMDVAESLRILRPSFDTLLQLHSGRVVPKLNARRARGPARSLRHRLETAPGQ